MTVRRLARNAAYNAGAWGASVVVALVATPYIVGKLTISGYGVYAALTGLVGFSALVDLGVGQGVIKFVSQGEAAGDRGLVVRSIRAALVVQLVLGSAFGMGVFVLGDPILRLFRVPPEFYDDAAVGVLLVALAFVLTMVTGTFMAVLQGLQRYDLTGRVSAVSNLFLTIALVAGLSRGMTLRGAFVIHLSYVGVALVVYVVLVLRAIPEWRTKVSVDRDTLRMLFTFSGFMFLARSSSLFTNHGLRFLVAALVGPAGVTYYVVPMKVINAIGGSIGSVTTVLFPYVSARHGQADLGRLQQGYIDAMRGVVAVALPIYLLLGLFSGDILSLWMGPTFAEQSWHVLSFLALGYCLSALTMVPSNFAFGLGYARPMAIFAGVVIGVGAISAYFLTSAYGTVGAAAGLAIGSLTSIPMVAYITTRMMGLSLVEPWRGIIRFHVAAVLILATTAIGIRWSMPGGSLMSLGAVSGGLVGAYLVAYIGFDERFRRRTMSVFNWH